MFTGVFIMFFLNRQHFLLIAFFVINIFFNLTQQLFALKFETARDIEMGLALSIIPLEIAANKLDIEDSPKIASAMHMLVDSISLTNKAFFFYNNIIAQENRNGEFSFKSRDMIVNGALVFLDIKDLFKHLGKIIPSFKNTKIEDDIDFYVPEFDDEELTKITGSQEISKLFQAWRIYILPCMRGLTAFALACSQQYATAYASPEALNLATASHSFVRLLTEQAALDVDPTYKKIIYIALAINAVWLLKEIQIYYHSLPAPMERVIGNCPICMNDDIELVRLHCGHTQCMECLRDQINVAFDKRGVDAFNKIPCSYSHTGCTGVLSRSEIAEVTNNRIDALKAYDEAGIISAYNETMSDKEVRRQGLKRCPNPDCRVTIQKGDACRHVVCTRCHHEFCWWCLGDNYRYQHENNGCNNHAYGANPRLTNQNWDYVRDSLTTRPPGRDRNRTRDIVFDWNDNWDW